jgi:hypothetical protein
MQPFGKPRRKRKTQIGAAQLNLGDNLALHCRLQAAFDSFDFWQLRHRRCDPLK